MNLLQCPESINERRDYIITLIDMYAKQLVNDMEIRDSELGVLISDTQDLLKQVPGDTIVEFQLKQLKHRQSELNMESLCYPSYNDLKSMMKKEEE